MRFELRPLRSKDVGVEKDRRMYQVVLGAFGELMNVAAKGPELIEDLASHVRKHDFPATTETGTSLRGWIENNNKTMKC